MSKARKILGHAGAALRPMESLAMKYRPRCLQELLGQPAVVNTLSHFIAQPCPVAMLFHGDTGTGKTSTAYALAHELGCGVDDEEMGGIYEIPSGEMGADEVRGMLRQLCFRPPLVRMPGFYSVLY